MLEAEDRILHASRTCRTQKKEEWDSLVHEWERQTEITHKIEICTCPYGNNNRFTHEDIERRTVCTRCRAFRARDALKIHVHEDFIPTTKRFRRAAIVFELELPRSLKAYREATWLIVRNLSHPTWPQLDSKREPKLVLQDFRQLKPYMSRSSDGVLTLASVSKSHLQTHFKKKQVSREKYESIVLGFGPDFRLFDVSHKIWVEDFDRTALTLEHLCGVQLPSALTAVVPRHPHPPTTITGPSSYQLLANQTLCPQHASLHEFSACQKLLFGSSQRWVNILVELGSVNLNFSSAETVRMLVQLAIRAGPRSSRTQRLREAFKVFEEPSFCNELAENVRNRLNTIKSNWRESNCMRLVIVLSECLLNFGQCPAGEELIKSAREIAMDWIRCLQQEALKHSDDNETDSSAIAAYAFVAALLCRRTFANQTSILSSTDLSIYCEASIALHQNTPASLVENCEIKAMMIHDTKMAYRLDRIISASLLRHPHALDYAVTRAWPFSKTYKFSTWTMDAFQHGWLSAKLGIQGPQFESSHTIHFNYNDGFLLLDSKPLGGLPVKIRSSQVVKQLFGTAHLRTVATKRNGMSHQLVSPYRGNEVYFGIRHAGTPEEAVVVQLSSRGSTVEFVPREAFTHDHEFDLPLKLRDESCVHFLNYTTGCLEIRRLPKIWQLKTQDWVINLRTRTCQRGNNDKISRLLGQESRLGNSLAQAFENFEKREGLLIYMSSSGRPHVELNRFELTFFINRNGLLQDNKSNMEFDEDQDAGTFYGLLSKIVLRDVQDTSKRSIIVPLGNPDHRLCGPHVEILMRQSDAFDLAKFDIDRVLGRLVTPPEPGLVFAKAYFHALTSFPIPDPLTSRTGMEEAFHILQSGAAHPWLPFGGLPLRYLERIGQLSPKRKFYPEDQHRFQTVQWNPSLLVTTQHDHLDTLVQDLIHKSHQLQAFEKSDNIVEPRQPSHVLRKRGEHERMLYEPSSLHPINHSASDLFYTSRDTSKDSRGAQNVASIVQCLFGHPFQIPRNVDLKAILQKQQVIGGFEKGKTFSCSLSKLFAGEMFDQWGELVRHFVDADASRPYSVAFHLALLAFHGLHDMHQVLAAFARVKELKDLQLPYCSEFTDLGVTEPEVEKFAILIKQLSPEFIPSKQCKLVAPARQRYENKCEAESRLLAKLFVEQWPARRPTLERSPPQTDFIDSAEALEVILETWDRLQHNRELGLFVGKVQSILDRNAIRRPTGFTFPAVRAGRDRGPRVTRRTAHFGRVPHDATPIPSLARDLLPKSTLLIPEPDSTPTPRQMVVEISRPLWSMRSPTKDFRELRAILNHFSESPDSLRQSYGEDLLKSLEALEKSDDLTAKHWDLKDTLQSKSGLECQINRIEEIMNDQRSTIIAALAKSDKRYQWLRLGDLWPGTETVTLLEQLRSGPMVDFGPGMKEALVTYGLLTTLRQWLGRVRHERLHKNTGKLEELLQNTGHENWNPIDCPDWLLMEIEANFMIRPRQVDVAHHIISPTSKQNSLTQLMMGEGQF